MGNSRSIFETILGLFEVKQTESFTYQSFNEHPYRYDCGSIIRFGNPDSKIRLTVFSNPHGNPCAKKDMGLDMEEEFKKHEAWKQRAQINMMKFIKYLIFYGFVFLLPACNTKEKADILTIPLEPVIIDVTKLKTTRTPLKLSQFADSISYILLSKDNSKTEIFNTSIKIVNDTIFVVRKFDNVYKYTPEGMLIRKIIDVKPKNSTIRFIYSAFNKKERYFTFSSYTTSVRQSGTQRQWKDYVNYSFDGVLLNEINYSIDNNYKLIDAYFDNCCLYRKDTIIGNDSQGNQLESVKTTINRLGPHLFYAENINSSSIVYSYPNPSANNSFPYKKSEDYDPGNMNFINIDSVLWFKHFVIDTLYSTQDLATITPRYIFKTDNSFMNINEYTQLKNGLLDENKVNKLKIIWGILPLTASGKLLFTINRQIAIADKNGDIEGFSNEPVINDIDEYIKNINIAMYVVQRTFYVENNYLYILVEANKFFEDGCKPPLETIKNDDSLIVLKIKLKT